MRAGAVDRFLVILNESFVDSWFERNGEGTYRFGSFDFLIWPYIVTEEQRDAIRARLLVPRRRILLAAIAIATIGFIALDLLNALFLCALLLALLTYWPLVWAGRNLADCPRVEKLKDKRAGRRGQQEESLQEWKPGIFVPMVALLSVLFVIPSSWLAMHGAELGKRGELHPGVLAALMMAYLGGAVWLAWVYRPRARPMRESAFGPRSIAEINATWSHFGGGEGGGDSGGDGGAGGD